MTNTYDLLKIVTQGSPTHLHTLASRIDDISNNGGTGAGINASLDIIILAGQSNMVGWVADAISPRLDYSDPRILEHSAFGTFANQAVLANDPLTHSDGRVNPIGLGMNFSRKYTQSNPASTVILLPHGHGGTGFSDNNWRVGDIRTEALVANANAVKNKFPNATFKAFLWHQGEKEVQNNVSREQYITWLTDFVAHLRSAINGASNTPFIAGEISRQWIDTQGAAGIRIQQVIRDIPTFINRSAVASSEGLSVHDGIHFNAASNRILGLRYYDKYLEALNHSIGPAVLSIPTNLVASPTDTSATLNWTQNGTIADSWILEYKLNLDSNWASVNVSSKPYQLSGLTTSTAYNYRVKAVKGSDQTDFSSVFNFSTTAVGSEIPNGVPTPQFRLTFNNNYADSSGNNVTTTFIPLAAGTAGITTDATKGNVFTTNYTGYLRVAAQLQPSYTKMCWVKVNRFLGNSNLISSNLTPPHAWWFPFEQVHAGHNPGDLFTSSNEDYAFDSTWQHLAVTFSDGTLNFYRNGAIVRTVTNYAAYAGQISPSDIFVAMYNPNDNNGLDGSFKNVMVWDSALTAANVLAIYQNEL
jgi:hypothetical protein